MNFLRNLRRRLATTTPSELPAVISIIGLRIITTAFGATAVVCLCAFAASGKWENLVYTAAYF